MKKILIITGGSVKRLEPFRAPVKKLGLDVVLASFSELSYYSRDKEQEFVLRLGETDIADFSVIYIRLVGKRLEDVSLLVEYAKKHGIRLVDRVYQESHLMPPTLSKALEIKRLLENDVPVPHTLFGSLDMIKEKGESLLGFPYVLKGTQGRKAREVWSPQTRDELDRLIDKLKVEEKQGKRFFAQRFIEASQRIRVFVVGGKVLGAITRPTKWRNRFLPKVDYRYPEGVKGVLKPVPSEDKELALRACRAVSFDIAGVDIVHKDENDRPYVLEVNAAPRWEAFKKDTGINVEEEILKFLAKL